MKEIVMIKIQHHGSHRSSIHCKSTYPLAYVIFPFPCIVSAFHSPSKTSLKKEQANWKWAAKIQCSKYEYAAILLTLWTRDQDISWSRALLVVQTDSILLRTRHHHKSFWNETALRLVVQTDCIFLNTRYHHKSFWKETALRLQLEQRCRHQKDVHWLCLKYPSCLDKIFFYAPSLSVIENFGMLICM